MILKEAFRYQNYLNSIINQCITYLTYDGNIMTTKQEHMRKKSNPDAEDETITLPKYSDLEYSPNQIIDFLMDVLREKEELTDSIDAAKSQSEVNIDSAMAINKTKQQVASVLGDISKKKSSEIIKRNTDYKFNIDGNQVPYSYEVKEVHTIDFDRNKVKGIVKKLKSETDEVSLQRDKLEVDLDVEYSPIYNVNNSFEDCLDIFVNENK